VPADARHGDGHAAEALAALHLRDRGLSIVERNVRSRHGEIDLVARDGATLVFVEVRLRRPGRFGTAADSITATKRTRMVAAARAYLAGLPRTPPCRFDVVLLDGLDPGRIEWLRGAFDVSGEA
jgi:putative endonuclease